MVEDLSTSLATVEAALGRLGRTALLGSLQTDRAPQDVRASLASVGLSSTLELETLYGWRDGTSSETSASLDDIQLFPGFHLLALEDAVENYRAFVTDARWTAGWLPVFANGGGDFYVVDLNAASAGAVRHFWVDEAEHPVEFDSLERDAGDRRTGLRTRSLLRRLPWLSRD